MIYGRRNIARVTQLLEDGGRLRVVARRPHLPPSVVGRLSRIFQELESTPGDRGKVVPW